MKLKVAIKSTGHWGSGGNGEITITNDASITYHIQCGNDSFGIWILS